MKHCLTESIPNLSHLVSMNLSYIGTDQAVYLLSKHCPCLEDLCLDHSSVSDRCARFFCGYEKASSSQVRKHKLHLYKLNSALLLIFYFNSNREFNTEMYCETHFRSSTVVGLHKFIRSHSQGYISTTVLRLSCTIGIQSIQNNWHSNYKAFDNLIINSVTCDRIFRG